MKLCKVVIAVALIACYSVLQAGAPLLVNYQGRLTGADQQPVATGNYNVSISIYDQDEGGSLIWGPQVFDGSPGLQGHGDQVPVLNGYFNLILGPVDENNVPLDYAFAGPDRYIGIQFWQDGQTPSPELTPRQKVLSAPYAIESYGSVPVGGVIPFAGSLDNLGENWQLCDGTQVTDPQSPFFDQFVPDMSGRFPRGLTAAENLLVQGGGDGHTHDATLTNVNINIESLVAGYEYMRYSIYSGPTNERALIAGRTNPRSSHGHDNGVASGTTDVSADLPAYIEFYYIMRIK